MHTVPPTSRKQMTPDGHHPVCLGQKTHGATAKVCGGNVCDIWPDKSCQIDLSSLGWVQTRCVGSTGDGSYDSTAQPLQVETRQEGDGGGIGERGSTPVQDGWGWGGSCGGCEEAVSSKNSWGVSKESRDSWWWSKEKKLRRRCVRSNQKQAGSAKIQVRFQSRAWGAPGNFLNNCT